MSDRSIYVLDEITQQVAKVENNTYNLVCQGNDIIKRGIVNYPTASTLAHWLHYDPILLEYLLITFTPYSIGGYALTVGNLVDIRDKRTIIAIDYINDLKYVFSDVAAASRYTIYASPSKIFDYLQLYSGVLEPPLLGGCVFRYMGSDINTYKGIYNG